MSRVVVGKADVFDPNYPARVVPVNCVGVMGRGVALEAAGRYPDLAERYRRACADGDMLPGNVYVYPGFAPGVWLATTKRHWREPSRPEWAVACCRQIAARSHHVGPVEIVVPALGCGLGGLDFDELVGPFVVELRRGYPGATFYLSPPGDP